jgi:hypothetical protein
MALKLHYHLSFKKKIMNKLKQKNDYIDNETIVSLFILIILSFTTMIALFLLRNF